METSPRRKSPNRHLAEVIGGLTLLLLAFLFAIRPALRRMEQHRRESEEWEKSMNRVDNSLRDFRRGMQVLDNALVRLQNARAQRDQEPREAVLEYRGIIAELQKVGPGADPMSAMCAEELGDLYTELGESENAMRSYAQARDIWALGDLESDELRAAVVRRKYEAARKSVEGQQ